MRALELARGAIQVGGVAGLEHLGGRVIHEFQRLAQRIVGRQVGSDGDRAALAEVVQLARAHAFLHVHQAGERNHRVIAAPHVDAVDVLRRGAAPGLGLHDHIVLLGIALVARHGAPAQHGLNRPGHHVHAHTQVGCALAVHADAQLGLVQAQVCIRCDDAGVLGHLGQHLPGHGVEVFVAVRGLDHIRQWPRPKALAQGRRRDQKGIHPRQRAHFGLQLAGHIQDAALALLPVHRAVNHTALRHRGVADVGEDAVKLGVVAPDLLQLQRIAVGVVQRGAIGRGDVDENRAPVFQRRQLLLHLGVHQRQPHCAGQHHTHHQPAGLEQRAPQSATTAPTGRDHPAQQPAISVRHGGEPALHGSVEPVGLGVVLEQQRAHHGRQRQRHKARHHHRTCQSQRKFHKQPPGAAGREGQRRIHGHQRECHGNDGEADFLGTLDGGREWIEPLFDVPVDVLQHHDGIVHHQPNRQHQRQQGKRVDGKAGQGHQRKSAHQTHRNGDDGNDGRAQGAQEHKNHQRHQHHRLGNGLVHALDRAVDEHRVVVGDVDGDVGRQVSLQGGQHRAHTGRQLQRVGRGLADHAHRNGIAAIEAHAAAVAGGAFFHACDIAHAHGKAVHGADHDVGELRRAGQFGLRSHAELALLRFDAARGQFQVVAANGVFHVLRGETVAGHALRVQPDAHGVAALAVNGHIGHASHRLQPGLDDAVEQIVDFERATRVAAEGQPHHGRGIGLHLGNHGFIHRIGQAVAHPRRAVAHLGGGVVGIFLQPESHADLALLGTADGGDDVHCVDPGNRIFEGLGHLRLDHLRRGPGVAHAHRDHGLVDLGVLTDRQAGKTHGPYQQDQQGQDGGEHRPADGDFSKLHGERRAMSEMQNSGRLAAAHRRRLRGGAQRTLARIGARQR